MQKVVFDTNVYISALNYKGVPHEILLAAVSGDFQLVISKQIIAELRGVLRVKFRYELGKLEAVEQLLLSFCLLVDPARKIKRIVEDPTDNMVLECAVEGKADYIVSGDKHLLQVKEFRGIHILRPADFLKKTSKI